MTEDYPSITLTLARGERPDVTLVAYGGMATLAAEAAFNVIHPHAYLAPTARMGAQ